jgi:hypothetical protein
MQSVSTKTAHPGMPADLPDVGCASLRRLTLDGCDFERTASTGGPVPQSPGPFQYAI